MRPSRSVVINRAMAIGWVIAGIVSFPAGWAYSVAFVTIASIYANAKTDWSTAEAADDRAVLAEIKELRTEVRQLRKLISQGRD